MQADRAESFTLEHKSVATTNYVVKAADRLKFRRMDIPVKKTLRKKSYQWLSSVCYALRSSTSFTSGLESFSYPPECRPVDPYSWNLLVTTADMGSDGVCPSNWLKYGPTESNIESRWGPAHRVGRDMMAGLRHAHFWTMMVLFMIVWNGDNGAWHDDERYFAMKDVVSDNFETLTHLTDPVFQWLDELFLRDRPSFRSCVEEGSTLSQTLYDKVLKPAALWRRKPDHVSTNRFFGAYKRAKVEIHEWTCRLYGVVCFMLETGTLPTGTRTLDLHIVKPYPARRSTARQANAARLVKQSCKGVVELTFLLYSEPHNRFMLCIVIVSGHVLHVWHQKHNVECRSGEETRKWL